MPPISRDMPKTVEPLSSRKPVVLADRFRIERVLDDGRYDAVDTTKGTAVVVTRVPFGAEPRDARDQLIERVRVLWTVTSPALVLPIDVGPWDEDVFVVEEKVEAPYVNLASGLAQLDAFERASAARNVAEGVAALHAAGFVHGALSLETLLLDGYRQPKIHTASLAVRSTTESERAEDHRLRALLEEIAPGVVSTARADATAAELARAIPHVGPGPTKPFVPSTQAPGGRQRLTLLAIVLTLVAFVAIGWLLRQL